LRLVWGRSALQVPFDFAQGRLSAALLMNNWRGKDSGAQPPLLCPDQQLPGAPYLARFLRDVGYHGSFPEPSPAVIKLEGRRGGIPHLAKNERDMGHPATVVGTEKTAKHFAPFSPTLNLPQASQPLRMTMLEGGAFRQRLWWMREQASFWFFSSRRWRFGWRWGPGCCSAFCSRECRPGLRLRLAR